MGSKFSCVDMVVLDDDDDEIEVGENACIPIVLREDNIINDSIVIAANGIV